MSDTNFEEIEIQDSDIVRTKELSENLGIGESTVRKYANQLTKHGYQFRQDEQGGRLFTRRDEVAMLELIKVKNKAEVSLDMAAKIVATRRKEEIMDVAPAQDVQPASDKDSSLEEIKNLAHEMRYMLENVPTKQQVGYIVDAVEKVLDGNVKLAQEMDELKKDKLDKEKENAILKEKLDTAVDLLQRIDERDSKRKGIFRKFFG